MIRSSLLRRTPLARTTPLARRTPLRKIGRKALQEKKERDHVRREVFERDGYTCQARELVPDVRCFGDLTFHHVQKASAQGGYTKANGLTLCATHNTWVENEPKRAHELGLVIKWWEAA